VPETGLAESASPYQKIITDPSGRQLILAIFPVAPPKIKVAAADVPEVHIAGVINTLSDVPAFDWSYGCSATSAAMLFGYYDRTGCSNMYAGPTNGGVCPLDNSVWGHTVWPSNVTCGECPLSATHNGTDGRAITGHVDDYWIDYGQTGPDPWVGNWTEHTADCTGDYMGTNQWKYGDPIWANTDGSTLFFWDDSGARLYDYTGDEPTYRDGCHGMRLFAESRGYAVLENFTQLIRGQGSNQNKGFTFADFQAEIDAGRPVLIELDGHTMLGYGYETTGNIIYVHDTWDYSDHQMTWGGTYNDMQHFGVTVIHLASFAGGSGTEGDPYQIADWYDLDNIRNYLDKHFVLLNDLNSATAGYTALASPTAHGGKGWQPIGTSDYRFAGTLNGQAYEIRDLFIDRPAEDRVGLFCGVLAGGVIENVEVMDADVTGDDGVGILVGATAGNVSSSSSSGSVSGSSYVGGLVGYNNPGGYVSNCHATGTVSGWFQLGGLVGYNNGGTVSNSHADGIVTGVNPVGGLVGYNYYGTVSNSHADGDVTGSSEVGGLVGYNEDGTVDSSYATGDVTVNDYYVGGLVGYNYYGTVSNSHADGIVTGNAYVGGLVGCNYYGDVSDSYATGSVDCSGTFAGGLVGGNDVGGTVSNSHATGSVHSSGGCVGGLVGYNTDGTVSSSYATGSVTGDDDDVGGLVGFNDGTVSNSYATGSVDGSGGFVGDVGGLVGFNHGTVSKCYSVGSVTGGPHVGGLVGLSDGAVIVSGWDIETSGQATSSGGTGKTTAQMKDFTTYLASGWDIIAVDHDYDRNTGYIWNIVDDVTYAFLSWQPAVILYDLTIDSTVGGNVTTPGEGLFPDYDAGTVVDLVAEAEEGYRFVNWTGDVHTIADVNAAATNITMNGHYSITANFVALYDLTISSTAGGNVTAPAEGTFTYDAGTVVDLVATPDAGYRFVNWTGDVGTIGNVTAASTNITMGGDYAITAIFHVESDQIGIFRPGTRQFALDMNGNGVWNAGVDRITTFGAVNDTPIIGDWTGDGIDEIGIFRPGTRQFALDMNGNGVWNAGVDRITTFGAANDTPIIGDWDGDGIDEIGIFRPGTRQFALDLNGNGVWNAGVDRITIFGSAGDKPIIGDWDGDGEDEIGIYRPGTRQFALDLNDNGVWNAGVDRITYFGSAGDKPIIGDWNGDDWDEIGIYRPGTSQFGLDMNGNGVWDAGVDRMTYFGLAGDKPVIGDWNGDGWDEIGIYKPGTRQFAVDLNGNGVWNAGVDRITYFGSAGDQPIIGCW
jgi:hypothetical protein